ncbi:hypothetical protein GCM10025771_01920 [Niveibacterium umoris]
MRSGVPELKGGAWHGERTLRRARCWHRLATEGARDQASRRAPAVMQKRSDGAATVQGTNPQ